MVSYAMFAGGIRTYGPVKRPFSLVNIKPYIATSDVKHYYKGNSFLGWHRPKRVKPGHNLSECVYF